MDETQESVCFSVELLVVYFCVLVFFCGAVFKRTDFTHSLISLRCFVLPRT